MEKFFKLGLRGTDKKTEIIAGLTTFMTMAYVLAVQPAAICGVYLHGLSGDLLARETPVGYTASDVARMVPRAREMVTGD